MSFRKLVRGAGLVGIVVLSMAAQCGKTPTPPDPQKSQASSNVFVFHDGTTMCAYVMEDTRQRDCGTTGVPESSWVSPNSDTVFNTTDKDGVSAKEHALAVILSRWPTVQRPPQPEEAHVEKLRANNPEFKARWMAYENSLVAASSAPPSATVRR